MLSTVVLPAPFGPIIENTWPASTSRLTFVTAWTPPNDFETSRISTCALISQRGPPPRSEHSRQPSLLVGRFERRLRRRNPVRGGGIGRARRPPPWPRHERATDRHHLLLPARDVAGAHLASLRQPRKVAIHELEVRLRGVAVLPRVAAGEEVLLDGEVLEDVPSLHHLDDAPLDDLGRVLPVDRLPPELDRALRHVAALGPE